MTRSGEIKKDTVKNLKRDLTPWGPLAMAMAGVVAAAPVLAIILKPIIVPIYTALGADASMFATTLLACDMGGYPLAMELASNETMGNFSGLILGTMMGPTLVFTIPVVFLLLRRKTELTWEPVSWPV